MVVLPDSIKAPLFGFKSFGGVSLEFFILYLGKAERSLLQFFSYLFLLSAVTFSGYAEQLGSSSPKVALEIDKPLELFVHANIEFTLLHELSHMFFDLYEVPLLGSEEDAADRVAVASILRGGILDDGFSAEEKLLAVAANWHAEWNSLREEQRSIAYTDSHKLEIQRAHTVACFVYGSDSDRYENLIYAHIMPYKRYIECEGEYEQALRSIGWMNNHYSRQVQGDISDLPGRIDFIFNTPLTRRNAAIQAIIKKYRYERVAALIESRYHLPKNVKIVFGMCRGRPDAAWDPVEKQVTLCYELVNRFFDMYLVAISHRAEGCKHPDFRRVLEVYFDCPTQKTALKKTE